MIHKLITIEGNTKITRVWERFEVQLFPSLLPHQLHLLVLRSTAMWKREHLSLPGSGEHHHCTFKVPGDLFRMLL